MMDQIFQAAEWVSNAPLATKLHLVALVGSLISMSFSIGTIRINREIRKLKERT